MTPRTFLIILIALFASACASTTPTFCNAESWQNIGYKHALAGGADQTQQVVNSCASEDAPLAYRLGFDYGLAKYCTFKQGLFSGKHGKSPVESCSDPKWDEYQNGYLTGHKIYQTSARLETISQDLESARHELWKLSCITPRTDALSAKMANLQQQVDQLEKVRQDESQHLGYLSVSTNRL